MSVDETLEQVSERSLEVISWSKREVLFPVVEAEEMRKRWKSVEQAAGTHDVVTPRKQPWRGVAG